MGSGPWYCSFSRGGRSAAKSYKSIVKACENIRPGYQSRGSRAVLMSRSCASADIADGRLGAQVAYVRF